ncbi:MAG TPA: hypothetical protein VKT80_00155, partial [Chloroflexota bacterium]|nr:hypothetical protein [Chloroflexota bacterium]
MSERESASLFTRLRQIGDRLFSRGSGETIVGVVGPGSSRVAIGKGIIQIDTLVIPLVPVLAGVLLVIAAGVVWYWYATVPTRMAGAYNIAV